MNGGYVAVGVGLAVWGAAFYAVCTWCVRDDVRMSTLVDSRWSIDRRVIKKIRRGEISREEWSARYIRSQRALVKWVFTPLTVLWLALCVAMIVNGVTST
jgi:hypothetical protein